MPERQPIERDTSLGCRTDALCGTELTASQPRVDQRVATETSSKLARRTRPRSEPDALAGEGRLPSTTTLSFVTSVTVNERLFRVARHALELHADLDRLGEALARLHAQELRVVLAEGVLGLEREVDLVAGLLALERLLDLGEDLAESAVKVRELGALPLESLPVAVANLVLEGDYGPGVNSHGGR